MKELFEWLSDKTTDEERRKDRYLLPNKMGDKLASKVPPVVIVTSEFDFFRHMSREARDIYKRNGKLLHYFEFGGGIHGSYALAMFEHSEVWVKDFKRLTDYYLQ